MKTHILLILFFSIFEHAYSQTTVYNYSCGNTSNEIVWEQHSENGLTYLTTTLEKEIQKYVMDGNNKTTSWEYSNPEDNTNIKIILKDGVYHFEGTLKSKTYTKTYKSKGKPWYQHIGFVLGNIIERKSSVTFECIRPDNLKLYEMQADVKETKTIDGIREQHIYTHLTGLLAKFFGSDYYLNSATKEFVRYEGVHGAPGTPKTIITLKQ